MNNLMKELMSNLPTRMEKFVPEKVEKVLFSSNLTK